MLIIHNHYKNNTMIFGLTEDEEMQNLTKRETEILKMLALGKMNKEISEDLCISIKTVETHRKNIMTKLNLRNLADIVRFAVRHKIIMID